MRNHNKNDWSGKRDSNSRPKPWQDRSLSSVSGGIDSESSLSVGPLQAHIANVPGGTRKGGLPTLLWLGLILMVLALLAGGWAVTPKEPPPQPCVDARANPICDHLRLDQ